MKISDKEIRILLHYFFKNGTNAKRAYEEISKVYGANVLTVRTSQYWFARFKSNQLSFQDAPRTGRPPTVKCHEILEIIKKDPQITTRRIALQLSVSQRSVVEHLQKAGYVKELGIWAKRKALTPEVSKYALMSTESIKSHSSKGS